jgi:hypothetical protein
VTRRNLGIEISPARGSDELKLHMALEALPARKGEPLVGGLFARNGSPPYAYQIASGSLPSGVYVNATTGRFVDSPGGTNPPSPSVVGRSVFLAEVQDSALAVHRATFAIEIIPALEPVAASPPVGEVSVQYNAPFGYRFAIAGETGLVRWTTSGDLPPGMWLGGQGTDGDEIPATTLTSAPTVVGSTLKLDITTPFDLQVPSATFEDGEWVYALQDPHVVYGRVVSGGGTSTIYLDIATAALYSTPTAMTAGALVSTDLGGALFGTPTAAGTFNLTVTATDLGSGDSLDMHCSLTIVEHGEVTFDSAGSVPDLGGTFIPPVYIGVPYSTTVSVSGGVPPYTFSDTNGELTTLGLSVNPRTGEVTGILTDASLALGYDSPILAEVIAVDALGAFQTTAQAALAVLMPVTSTDTGLSSNSNQLIPTQRAVKTYVDAVAGSGSFAITQVAHGFTVGKALRLHVDSSGAIEYAKAQADSMDNAEVVGIVSSVVDSDNFILTSAGHMSGLSGLTPGALYYLSRTTAGALTGTEPTSGIYKRCLVADSATSGFVLIGDSRGGIQFKQDGIDVGDVIYP